MTHDDAFKFLRDAFVASGVNGYELDFDDNIIRFRGVKFKASTLPGVEPICVVTCDHRFYADNSVELIRFIQNTRRD